MRTIDFNINDHIWVKLTAAGLRVHKDYWEPHSDGHYRVPEIDSEGWSRFQMHEVAKVFGSSLSHVRELPFETSIRFEVKDAKL